MANDNWGAEDWRQPTPSPDDTVLFSEHGRILDQDNSRTVDCRSHSFKVVKRRFGGVDLLVKHGGGEERIEIDYCDRIVAALAPLTSDQRYWLLHSFLSIATRSKSEERDRTASRYRQAFANGRLKKRKQPGRDAVKVWIEDRA